jgi:amino acid adenylation domain-containing protein
VQVESFLEVSAARSPDKTALICGPQRLSYGEIERRCNRLAHSLREAGVAPRDRVAVQLENGVEAVVGIFGTLKAGATFLTVNASAKPEKLVYVLNDCRAAALITDRERLRALEAYLQDLPYLRVIVVIGADAAGCPAGQPVLSWELALEERPGLEQPPKNTCIDMDVAALVYTSGSTGKPKSVMVTHLNICSTTASVTRYLENTAEDIILNVLPLSFTYGLDQIFMAFRVGATVVLERSFAYPYAVLETMQRERATGFPLVPTISATLLEMDLGGMDFPHLRYITNAAAAWPVDHIRKLRRLLPRVKLYSMYGLSECKRVSYLDPAQIDIRPESVGRGMPNQEVYIVDESGRRLPPGETGELVVRGSHVMPGYWERPEETARVLRPGTFPWEKVLYTGDLFRMDEEGYLYFVARKDDIIKTRGEKVSPREVEEALYGIQGVVEAAVVGVQDPILGQALKAVLALRDGVALTEQDVRWHCARLLEDFMVPKYVEFRSSLPKTPSGKIVRRELTPEAGALA